MAAWYVKHLGMKVVPLPRRAQLHAVPGRQFGHAMIEIYANSTVRVPDYRSMNLLTLHLAFEPMMRTPPPPGSLRPGPHPTAK